MLRSDNELNVYTSNSMKVDPTKKYWFGDPCYIFDNNNEDHTKIWFRFCELMFSSRRYDELSDCGIFSMNGEEMLYMSTAYGDGVYAAYTSKSSKDCGVDAGMLAFVPFSFIEKLYENKTIPESIKELGMIVENENGMVYANPGERTGSFIREGFDWSGVVLCETSGTDDEDYDDEYYNPDDDELDEDNYNADADLDYLS